MDGRSVRDADLVARAKAGDVNAFDGLVMRHRTRLFRLAREVVADVEAAQDVVQEGLLRAYQALPALRDGERFGAWVSVIVRRVAQDCARDRHRRQAPLDANVVSGVFTSGWFPSALPSEARERIRDALGALSHRERQVMILHYLEGRTCEEIAAQLRVSTGTVKSILHYSRRKVRKECAEMAEAEGRRKGPRLLSAWTEGDVGWGQWDVFDVIYRALNRSILLCVNKVPKAARQIAEEVEAHVDYVACELGDLLEYGLVTSPRRDRFLTHFLAFDAEDYRRLMRLVRQPAAAVAKRLVEAQPRLREAFGRTPLHAAGWKWEEVTWVVNCLFAATHGVSRHRRAGKEAWPRPERPGGCRYWVGGHEYVPDMAGCWTTSVYGPHEEQRGTVFFGPSMEHKQHQWLTEPPGDPQRAVVVLLDGPVAEEEALARLAGDRERWRAAFARLIQGGLVQHADGQLRLTVPVFTEGDSEVLTPEVDALMAPLMAEIVDPIWGGLDKSLDEMGYAHCREQYALWHKWLTAFVMGESLRFLVEHGVLPALDENPPSSHAFAAWKGKLALTSW